MCIIMYIELLPRSRNMRQTTFTELRNNAKAYFDAVEAGETVRVLRNGKPIADIVPVPPVTPSWKRQSR